MPSTKQILGALATVAVVIEGASIIPLNNYNPVDCMLKLSSGNDLFPTVITGFTGCPHYEKLLPVFNEACQLLPKRDCYSFNYTDESDPRNTNCPLQTHTVQSCLGYIPVGSPTLSQYMIASGSPPLGTQALGPLNLGGGIGGNSTVKEVTNFINTLPGPGTKHNSLFKKHSVKKEKVNLDISDEEMADSPFGLSARQNRPHR